MTLDLIVKAGAGHRSAARNRCGHGTLLGVGANSSIGGLAVDLGDTSLRAARSGI
jgi:hypothetical protein